MTKNRTPHTIVLSTILALLTVGFLALSVSAHTATPTQVSSSSVAVHSVSLSKSALSEAKNRHIPFSYIYYDANYTPYYYPSFISCKAGRGLTFVISNQTSGYQYVTANGQIITTIPPYSSQGYNIASRGTYYLGLYYSSSTLTISAH